MLKTYEQKFMTEICVTLNPIFLSFPKLGGGYLVGNMDSAGQLTGSDITFLYPDLKTGITGNCQNRAGQRKRDPRVCILIIVL